nr:EOG090X0GYO [Eulimnadia texana]
MVRFKNRYLVFEITPTNSGQMDPLNPYMLNSTDLYHAVMDVVEQIHGEFGAAAVNNGIDAKYCNEHTRMAVLRVRHGPHRLVSSSLPFLKKIGNRTVVLHSLYTGATLNKCFKFIKAFQKERLNQLLQLCKTETQREKLVTAMSNYGDFEAANKMIEK